MKTIYSEAITAVITRRDNGSLVLTTSNGVEFEFGEKVPKSAVMSGMLATTLCRVLTIYSCDVIEFGFSMRLSND